MLGRIRNILISKRRESCHPEPVEGSERLNGYIDTLEFRPIRQAQGDSKFLKLNAFTLMDVLAGMVIMSIVIGMVFGVLNSVNRHTIEFQKLRIELNDFMLMNSDLDRQVDLCQTIYEVPNGFILEGQQQELKYFMAGEALLRESELSTDTLHTHVASIEFDYHEGGAASNKLVSQITIKTKLREQELSAYFFKEYGKAEPINHLLLNEL